LILALVPFLFKPYVYYYKRVLIVLKISFGMRGLRIIKFRVSFFFAKLIS
jgi:hypothetical protein